jgi:hypothetical protein
MPWSNPIFSPPPCRYLDNIAYDEYIPSLDAQPGRIASEDDTTCLSSGNQPFGGHGKLEHCAAHNDDQEWVYNNDGYIQLNHYPRHMLLCLHLETIAMVGCDAAPKWEIKGNTVRMTADGGKPGAGHCLEMAKGNKLRARACDGSTRQTWTMEHDSTGRFAGFTMEPLDMARCLDNMQHNRGAPGLYGCHGGQTQRWKLTEGGGEDMLVCVLVSTRPYFFFLRLFFNSVAHLSCPTPTPSHRGTLGERHHARCLHRL